MTCASSAMAETSPARKGWVRRDIVFQSKGVDLHGALFRPAGVDGKLPGIVITGPYGSVREQSPMQYATRLAMAGYACLIFDATGSGASGGALRRSEGPAQRAADIHAATDALVSDPGTDAARIGALGICQGASYMMFAVSADLRFKALACVSGQYLYLHGEQSDGFLIAARTVYDALTVKDRKLVIEPGIFHTRFYDDPEIVDGAASEVMDWLGARI